MDGGGGSERSRRYASEDETEGKEEMKYVVTYRRIVRGWVNNDTRKIDIRED